MREGLRASQQLPTHDNHVTRLLLTKQYGVLT